MFLLMNELSFHYKNNVDCNDNYLGEYADLCFVKCSLTALWLLNTGRLKLRGIRKRTKDKANPQKYNLRLYMYHFWSSGK